VAGDWKNARQHIKLALHKYSTADGERRVRCADGMPSHTIFSLLKKFDGFALLEAELKTGRTHQIRVHLSSSGFPIVGDDKYGDFPQQGAAESPTHAARSSACSCTRINYLYPSGTGKNMTLNAPLAAECERFLVSLGKPLN
jgi:23S rRNA pseudouridine955/2504/2580 synthase